MAFSPIILFHVVVGTLVTFAGFFALFSRKGNTFHRRTGNLFFWTMTGTALSGMYLSSFVSEDNMGTTLIGAIALYMIFTSQWTVKNKSGKIGLIDFGLLVFALVLISVASVFAMDAARSENGLKGVYPPLAFYIFGGIVALGAILDIRVIYLKGIVGRQRIVRHLWRMCFAFLLACISFFVGQPQIWPKFVQESGLLPLPVFAVFLLLIFWVIRVYVGKKFKHRQLKTSE